ncbi:MAG: CoA transferase [Myxococcales bacterium]|nr:CoA transferase [Myxococcales bacterium]
MNGPLSGLRVLDLSQFLSGPRAGQIFSMLGAEVVKVESPAGDTMRLLLTLTQSHRAMHAMHQGKRGLVIDFQHPKGAGLLLELAARADVLIENFAPGVMDKWGLGYQRLQAANPRLIQATIRGFGMTGPQADRTAFDLIAQATGGILFANHQPDRPPGAFFGDLCAGAFAAIGVLVALHERERTGRGKAIDVSMQDVMYFHNFWAFCERATEPDRERIRGLLGGNMQSLLSDPENPMPFWNSYRTADGYAVVVALTDKQWRSLMAVIGRPELGDDPRFAGFVERINNASAGIEAVASWAAERTTAELVAALSARKIPCGAVNDYDAVNNDPQLHARGMLAAAEHPRYGQLDLPGFPVRFAGEPAPPVEPGPEMGEHTAAVLTDWLGLDEAEIDRLRKDRVVV